uniref:Fibronectin type-III domain-containing protein n=1 Tax=Heterorhabditis bacteriophora TaxID=37862 RepID=A0A1I7XGL1_HETBA
MIDEIDTLFCHEKQWINTLPVCRGKGLCEHNNGGCSHSCLSFNDEKVECKCPRGMVLDIDQKTCIKPIPKTLCRTLAGCSCSSIDDNQYSCTCPKGSKCLCKLFISINFQKTSLQIVASCPIFLLRGNDEIQNVPSKAGTVKSEQILIIKELYKNAEFTCHANNSVGKVERTVKVTITGPGSAPVLRGAKSGRTSTSVRWDPPHIINRPITGYTVYYTNNGNQPIKNWKRIDVKEPNRDVEIQNLRPSTQYFIRLRANDQMGPGRLGNPVSVTTLKPASRPLVTIEQGEELRVSPLAPFELSCKITRADPVPTISWQHK